MDLHLFRKFKAWLGGAKLLPFLLDSWTICLQFELSLVNKTDARKDYARSGIGGDYLTEETALTAQCINNFSRSKLYD